MNTGEKKKTGILKVLLLFSPLIVTGLWIIFLMYQWYVIGYNLVAGLHGFLVIMQAMLYAPILIATLVGAILAMMHLKNEETLLRAGTLTGMVAALVISFSGLWYIPGKVLYYARMKRLRTLDYDRIAQECATLSASVGENGVIYAPWQTDPPHYDTLPPYIKSLEPRFVHVMPSGVVIQIDGGGPASHEGIFVLIKDFPSDIKAYAKANDITVVNAKHYAFYYCLYDYRSLPIS